MSMDLIVMDLIGPFEITSKGNQYDWTVVCLLINYIPCILIPNKTGDIFIEEYLFCEGYKILSDNGSEF